MTDGTWALEAHSEGRLVVMAFRLPTGVTGTRYFFVPQVPNDARL